MLLLKVDVVLIIEVKRLIFKCQRELVKASER